LDQTSGGSASALLVVPDSPGSRSSGFGSMSGLGVWEATLRRVRLDERRALAQVARTRRLSSESNQGRRVPSSVGRSSVAVVSNPACPVEREATPRAGRMRALGATRSPHVRAVRSLAAARGRPASTRRSSMKAVSTPRLAAARVGKCPVYIAQPDAVSIGEEALKRGYGSVSRDLEALSASPPSVRGPRRTRSNRGRPVDPTTAAGRPRACGRAGRR
jgi:hypothetical protein